ncbi:MAG: insulinase family protein [bacterium]|nr:insulinase family protein [bacterium]
MEEISAGIKTAAVKGNGLKIIWEEISTVKSVTLGLWVKAGVANENERTNGISHLIEHLTFQGTESRKSYEISREIDYVGGVLNAFTDHEHTVYVARVLDDHLELAMDLLSDLVIRPAFREEDIKKEKNVVLEEIRMYDDTPSDKIHDLIACRVYPDKLLSMPVLGYSDTVSALWRGDFVNYHKNRYNASTSLLTAAGNIEPERFIALTEHYFGQLPNGSSGSTAEPSSSVRPLPHYIEKDNEQIHLCLGYEGIAYNDPKRYAAAILTTLFGGTPSSRLFRKVRDEYGLAYAVYCYNQGYRDCGIMTVYAATAPQTAEQTRDLILEEIQKLVDNGPDETEIRRCKETIKGHILLALESTSARMDRLARNELFLGRHYTLEEIVENIDRVTRDDVYEQARRVFDGEPKVAAIGPGAGGLVDN